MLTKTKDEFKQLITWSLVVGATVLYVMFSAWAYHQALTWMSDSVLTEEIGYTDMYGKEIPFDEGLMETLQFDGKIFILHFTADWCTYCIAQEPMWNSPEMEQVTKDMKIVRMKVDMTDNLRSQWMFLKEFNRQSIPTYVMIKGGEDFRLYNGWGWSANSFVKWVKKAHKDLSD